MTGDLPLKFPIRHRVYDRADKLAAMAARVRNRGDAPPRTETVVFNVTPDELARLDVLAHELGVKRNRAVRLALHMLFTEQERANAARGEGRAA